MIQNIDLLYPEEKSPDRLIRNRSGYPKSFIQDLGLQPLALHLCPANSDYAMQILTSLCADEETIAYRQAVLQDILEIDGLGESIIEEIDTMDKDTFQTFSSHYGNTKVDVFYDISLQLRALQTYIQCMANCYRWTDDSRVKSKGIKKFLGKIREVYESESFRLLKQGVESVDNMFRHSVRSITIAVNLDNFARPCGMALLSVNDKPFTQKTLLAKIIGAGANKFAVDPIGKFYKKDKDTMPNSFEMALFNNLKKMHDDMLTQFSVALKNFYKLNTEFLTTTQPQLEFYLGCKRLIQALSVRGLPFCRPKIADKDSRTMKISGMADLTLAFEMIKQNPSVKLADELVVNDVEMNDFARIFIVTGPNHGGKTSFTRSVGISQVLFQAGLYIPGTSAEISPADWIFTHFQREEQLGLDKSRLSLECKQLRTTTELATSRSLILLNEAFSSTATQESFYIAAGTVRFMRRIGCRAVFTTHIVELARKIDEIQRDVDGDSVIVSLVAGLLSQKFHSDKGELNRSYKIERGQPQDYDYAIEILEKYGLNFDEILGETGCKA